MKDVVSFETAKRLKAAGFPQPSGFGFFIYDNVDDEPFFIKTKEASQYYWLCVAPTATDILKELGCEWNLYFDNQLNGNNQWHCFYDATSRPFPCHKNNNPAEACAAAYLSIHEKTANQ